MKQMVSRPCQGLNATPADHAISPCQFAGSRPRLPNLVGNVIPSLALDSSIFRP